MGSLRTFGYGLNMSAMRLQAEISLVRIIFVHDLALRPAIVEPQPLLWMFTDPGFYGRVDVGHDGAHVGFFVVRARDFERFLVNHFKTRAGQADALNGNHRRVEAQRKLGNGGSGHGFAAHERHGDAVIEFLIDQNAQVLTLFQQGKSTFGPWCAFGDQFAGAVALSEQFLQQRVVRCAVKDVAHKAQDVR